jgi:predicted dinucleotide-binding enzyme
MTTAVIGTGGIGSVIARRLASGGETLRLSSREHGAARGLAAEIGRGAVAAIDNRDALRSAHAVVLALGRVRAQYRLSVIQDGATSSARADVGFGAAA